jgi:asparagine synthase (glutamine-hydrolysing)
MCGIAGFYRSSREDSANQVLVQRMCDQIVHRGPDDAGYHTDPAGCAIGMRRLSIIDLHTGHQPIANEDGSVWVVFNGEIYNYRRLRDELLGRGHRFRTNSDTETIVHLYEEYGLDGLSRLEGMFAFAIWDSRHRQLLLVRDRFGKKPLYYSLQPDGLYFGSELKCLSVTGIPLNLDPDSLRLYLQFTYVPDPRSIFRQVSKVEPGGWLLYSPGGSPPRQGLYWSLPATAVDPPPGLTETAAQNRLGDLFDEAVRSRMVADVPLGAFLSGGLDSSAVVASMALQSSQPIKTFSIGFEESTHNELPYAQMVADRYRTDHHTLTVRPDSIQLVSKLIEHLDEPFADSSAIPTYLVSEFAARHVKVVLTGDGGDEMFAGYDSFALINRNRRWDRLPLPLRRVLAPLAKRLPAGTYGRNYLYAIARPSALERYFQFNYSLGLISESLLRPQWRLSLDEGDLRRFFPRALLPSGTDVLTQAFHFEATAKLTGDMLVKVDRMSMANSLEVRCPMLDHGLAVFATQLPPAWKMQAGFGKYCLIQAFRDRLPEAVWNRPKQGFSVPIALWFRGPLRAFLHDHLTSRSFLDRGIVEPAFLRHLLDEHDSGRRDHRTWLWSLLILELWFRRWQDPHPSRL